MDQMSLAHTGFELVTKTTHKRELLDELNSMEPWAEFVALIAPHAPTRKLKVDRPSFAVSTLLRTKLPAASTLNESNEWLH
jgi:IS5 family transposase